VRVDDETCGDDTAEPLDDPPSNELGPPFEEEALVPPCKLELERGGRGAFFKLLKGKNSVAATPMAAGTEARSVRRRGSFQYTSRKSRGKRAPISSNTAKASSRSRRAKSG